MGDWFVRGLIVQYALAAIAYGIQGAPWKACYFVGAFIISIAVLKLK